MSQPERAHADSPQNWYLQRDRRRICFFFSSFFWHCVVISAFKMTIKLKKKGGRSSNLLFLNLENYLMRRRIRLNIPKQITVISRSRREINRPLWLRLKVRQYISEVRPLFVLHIQQRLAIGRAIKPSRTLEIRAAWQHVTAHEPGREGSRVPSQRFLHRRLIIHPGCHAGSRSRVEDCGAERRGGGRWAPDGWVHVLRYKVFSCRTGSRYSKSGQVRNQCASE